MAVVNGKSDIKLADADPAKADGVMRVIALTVANLATDSSGSKYLLCTLPSCAVLDSNTAFKVDGWGFADIRLGTATDNDALASVAKSAGATVSPITKFGANHGKPLWKVLGLAADPGGNIDIYAHAIANATGAGSMLAEVHYRWRG